MAALIETALRTFDSDLLPLLKGVSLVKVAPVILIAIAAFFLFQLFFADSEYTPYARSVALTAANVWDRRNELGLSPNIRGRTLSSMEPLVEVLDALTASVKKYEYEAAPNYHYSHGQSSKIRFQ